MLHSLVALQLLQHGEQQRLGTIAAGGGGGSRRIADGVAAQRKRVEDRVIQIEQDRLLRDIAGQDDTKFVNIVNEYIEKYKAEGKPVYTLMRALDYREPQLIPAMLQKGKRTVKE